MDMKRPFIRAEYYETYYFATCIRNILHDQFAFVRHLHDFYGDDAYLAFVTPFPRFSALHSFIEFVVQEILTDDTEKCDLSKRQEQLERYKGLPSALHSLELNVLPIEDALRFHAIPHISFVDWLTEMEKTFDQADEDDVCEYLESLRDEGVIPTLLEQAVRETFYVLFGNRQLLKLFNQMMADQVQETKLNEIDAEIGRHFARDGVLQRAAIPKWVQRAVFYRDRGLCGVCGRDLSGLVSIWCEDQYDHIVSLANSGLNDVSNIQLLCGDCNRRKSFGEPVTSARYEDWYEL
jgi:hypothetical protein